MRIRTLIKRRKKALQQSTPKQRDRMRHRFQVAVKAAQLRKEAS